MGGGWEEGGRRGGGGGEEGGRGVEEGGGTGGEELMVACVALGRPDTLRPHTLSHSQNFTIEEQNKILEAKRSNNELDATKLMAALADCGVEIHDIQTACRLCITRMREGLVAAHGEDFAPHLPKKLSAS